MDEKPIDFTDKDLEPVDLNDSIETWSYSEEAIQAHIDAGYGDELGHVWTLGWEESDRPHPGFGGSQNIYGCHVYECMKCGMYQYESRSLSSRPGIYEGQVCGKRVR